MRENIKRCFICDYSDKEIKTSKIMPIEEIIAELCRWMEVWWYGIKIEFYNNCGGAYVEITLYKSISPVKRFEKKRSFYIPGGNVSKEHFSFVKDEVKEWFMGTNEEYRKEYISQTGREPNPDYYKDNY